MVACLIWLSAFFPLVFLVVFLLCLSFPSPWVCVLVGCVFCPAPCGLLFASLFGSPWLLLCVLFGVCGLCFCVVGRGFPFGLCCI